MIGDKPENPPEPETDVQKPDYLDESFWDDSAKQVRLQEMAKALKDTQTNLRNKEDEMREQILAEIKEGRPESPAGYEIGELKLDLPEGVEFSIPKDDPAVKEFREWAHETGLTKEQFQKGIGIYAKTRAADIPNREKEIEALGENAQSRIDALVRTASSKLNEQEWETFKRMTATAQNFEILEKLSARSVPGPATFQATEVTPASLQIELDKLMDSPEYLRGDQAYNERALELSQRIGRMRRSQAK